MEYISREEILAEYDRQHKGPAGGARKIMETWPAADVVPVVRCKDCKHATMSANGWCVLCAKVNPKGTLNFPSGFFCALGERG